MKMDEFIGRMYRVVGRFGDEYLDRLDELGINVEEGEKLLDNLFCYKCGSFCGSSLDMMRITEEELRDNKNECGIC